MNMPWELYEYIDVYVSQMKEFKKLEYFAIKEIRIILNKILVEYLKIKPVVAPIIDLNFNFKAMFNQSGIDLYQHKIVELIMTNRKLHNYLNEVFYQHDYKQILIEFSNKSYFIKIDDFEKHIWEKCLKKSSKNEHILQMKKRADELKEIAWDLLDKITSY